MPGPVPGHRPAVEKHWSRLILQGVSEVVRAWIIVFLQSERRRRQYCSAYVAAVILFMMK